MAAATLVGEVAGNWLLPKVLPSTGGGQLVMLTSIALNPVLCGGATALAVQFFSPSELSNRGWAPLALIGSGAYVTADYLTKGVFRNYF